jgi:hypothetical protein
MANQELISGLVETYRTLNMSVRTIDESKLQQPVSTGGSVRDLLKRMRDDELRFSQALKERISGVPIPDIFGDDLPTLGTETGNDTSAMMIAQFGTARESTLAMLRDLPEPEWDAADGDKSIRTRVLELVDNDKRQMERINGMLAAR